MGDRLDIDALLIGALYGELDGDDRARLDAHLVSHPADRAALDELRRTRSWLHDQGAREALGAAEPANAISARLIQEAARRAPAPRAAAGGGVFGFLTGLFRPLAAHPALSAAAALVIVIGAGSMMMRHKSLDVAQPAAPTEPVAAAPAPALPPGEGQGAAAPAAGSAVGSGDGFAVSLDPGVAPTDVVNGDRAEFPNTADTERLAQSGGRDGLQQEGKKRAKPASGAGTARAQAKDEVGFLELDKAPRGADVQLRDLDDSAARETEESVKGATMTGGVAPGAGGGGAPATSAKITAPADAPAPVPQRSSDPANLAWARDQHARMTKLVTAGRCSEVGQIGAEIARRAPDYYQSTVANDRSIRSCQQYVDQARRAKQPVKAKNNTADTEVAAPDATK